jgi:hypothetical protein
LQSADGRGARATSECVRACPCRRGRDLCAAPGVITLANAQSAVVKFYCRASKSEEIYANAHVVLLHFVLNK